MTPHCHLSHNYCNQNIPLTDLCKHYNIELQPHGEKLYGYCPFHEDSTLSFVILPKQNIWRCNCGGGDAVKFVMKMETISFKQALEKLKYLSTKISKNLLAKFD